MFSADGVNDTKGRLHPGTLGACRRTHSQPVARGGAHKWDIVAIRRLGRPEGAGRSVAGCVSRVKGHNLVQVSSLSISEPVFGSHVRFATLSAQVVHELQSPANKEANEFEVCM